MQTRPGTGAMVTAAGRPAAGPGVVAGAGTGVDAGMTQAHSPMRAKPGPITSHTRSAGASMRNCADISGMPPGWRLAAGLAIPGKGIAARVAALAHFRS